jgi:hypothetical protein
LHLDIINFGVEAALLLADGSHVEIVLLDVVVEPVQGSTAESRASAVVFMAASSAAWSMAWSPMAVGGDWFRGVDGEEGCGSGG